MGRCAHTAATGSALPSRSFATRLTSCANLRKCCSFSFLLFIAGPGVAGNTYTRAPYSDSFCNPNLHFLCANNSYVISPLNATTRGANSSSFCDSTMRPSAKSSRTSSAAVFDGRLTRSVNPMPNSITRFMPLRRWSGRVLIPLAYLFRGSHGAYGSIMLRKLSLPLTAERRQSFLNRGRRSGHPSIWLHGAPLYCATLAVRSIQPGLLVNLAKAPILSTPNPHPLPSKVAREDEHLLVSAAKSGDTASFEELVNRYEKKIFRLTMNITRNHEDAEDAMQDAFMKAYSHLNTFQEGSRFYTWLVRIAANEALMRLRKRRPNQVSLDEPIEGEDDFIPQQIQDWGPSPEQRYAQTEMRDILRSVIEELPPDFRVVFVLRDVEGLSTEETAETVGISEAAVKSRLLRARLKLRQKLDRHFRQDGKR